MKKIDLQKIEEMVQGIEEEFGQDDEDLENALMGVRLALREEMRKLNEAGDLLREVVRGFES